jgi:hypothetical protein
MLTERCLFVWWCGGVVCRWFHRITLEEIIPDTHHFELLDGNTQHTSSHHHTDRAHVSHEPRSSTGVSSWSVALYIHIYLDSLGREPLACLGPNGPLIDLCCV